MNNVLHQNFLIYFPVVPPLITRKVALMVCSFDSHFLDIGGSPQFSSVQSLSHVWLCDPMNHSTPGLPVHHHLGVHSDSCPSSRWRHPAISSSVVPFSSCPQFLPASGSFPMKQLFAWGSQRIGVSASASGGSLGHTLICYYSQNRNYTKKNSTWRKKDNLRIWVSC